VRTLGGRYQLEQCIGVGGMSEVWRGFDEVLARPVAIKLIAPDMAAADNCDERVRTEARSAAQLVHPNVASVYDFGTAPVLPDRDAPFIVMELIDGATLADHLVAGPLDWHIAVRICAEVSAALAAAHRQGIIHRDVKPANVMLTPSGAKVLDFGIATGTGRHDAQPDGTVLGTPAYVAPERLIGKPATPATDIYALGVLLYQCLSGRLPWPGDNGRQLLRAQRQRPPDPLPAVAGLDPEVAELCMACLSEDPQERPSSVVAALVLAEAVDARVYVPSVAPSMPALTSPRRERGAPDDERRYDLPTDQAPPPEPDEARDDVASDRDAGGGHVGRHRAQ
jgi:eukaryotic-like serine/threonine-protein kinase